MRGLLLGTMLLLALSAIAPIAVARADEVASGEVASGRQQFLTSCGVCHTAELGAGDRQGPNLFGVFGRRAGTLPGFSYSSALKNGDWTWDETTLDAWITNAQAAHPGTVMNYRQANAEKRRLVIEYLRSLSAAK